MMKSRLIIYLFMTSVVAAGSIIAVDEYLSDSMDEAFAPSEAMAQSAQPSLAQMQERQLRFPPGQYLYWGDEQINRITKEFTEEKFLPPFSMSDGNAVNQVIIPKFGSWLNQEVTPHFTDPSLAIRYVTLMLNAGYDATAPYHETAVGVYSRIENRPASEYADSTNMNIASIYAAYRLLLEFDADREPQWRSMLTSNGLDPDDERGLERSCFQAGKHALESPVAIGNLAGKCVLEGRYSDGFNHFGDETPGYPFMDTTGYVPVNSAKVLVDPSRWQPQIIKVGEEYVGQQYVTPQWANTQPYTDINPRDMRADPPTKSNHVNAAGYKQQVDEVISEVAALDDRKKILAEYFDNKARGTLFFPQVKYDAQTLATYLHNAGSASSEAEAPNTRDFWQVDFLLHIAEFDAGIVAWQEKTRYDTVRPVTAIKHVYGDDLVRTYDKKDGSPLTIPASQWRSYVGTGNHPEYPSATTCICAAEAQAWRNLLGGDEIPSVGGNPGFTGTLYANSSIHERGITPANNVTITFDTWTEWVDACGDSRVWSGAHFRTAVDEAVDLCTPIGDHAYDYFRSLLDGTAPQKTGPDQKQSPDPLLLSQPHFTGR